jgi:thiol-disulfide isomerase/thioredoxin
LPDGSTLTEVESPTIDKPHATLTPGMPAPAYRVGRTLRGEPFAAIEPGHIHVLAFWATWSGSCAVWAPHVSALSRQLASAGVRFVGVNVLESTDNGKDPAATVAAYLGKRGLTMEFPLVADNDAQTMANEWLKASGQQKLPAAVVVDRDGKIAWAGHWGDLDAVLDAMVRGAWDPQTGPDQVKQSLDAYNAAIRKYDEGVDAGDAAWADAERLCPVFAWQMTPRRVRALVGIGEYERGNAMARTVADRGVREREGTMLMETFNAIAVPTARRAAPDDALLLRLAQGYFDLDSPTGTPTAHVIMARAHYAVGNKAAGRISMARALELETDPKQKRRLEQFAAVLEDPPPIDVDAEIAKARARGQKNAPDQEKK